MNGDLNIPKSDLLTREQVAVMFRISVRTLDRMIKEGKIEYLRVGHGRGRILFTPRQVQDALTIATQPIVLAQRRRRRRTV